MAKQPEYIGFIRYEGKPLKNGYLDARKSAEALLGIDESLRYFVGKQDSELSKINYEIPVRIQPGSWQAFIPHDITSWFKTALGVAAVTYFTTAAKRMADNDFKDAGLIPLFKKAIQAMQWMIKIGKHLGSLSKRSFDNLRFQNGTQEIGIPNNNGEYLYVPKIFLELFEQIPASILKKLASIVTKDIKLEIGVWSNNRDEIESLEMSHKTIFCPDDETLFPELKHNMEVKLKGLVTRGNENSNSIGFEYQCHILTCYPCDGSIVRFKPELFLNCEIEGVVSREDKFGSFTELRPKIKFSKLTPLEKDAPKESQPGLFDDET
jgi:hypothetical protein